MSIEDRLERMLPVWLQHTVPEGNEGVGDPASWVQHTFVALGIALVLTPFIGWLEGRRIAFGLYAGRELVQFLVHFFHGGGRSSLPAARHDLRQAQGRMGRRRAG